MKKMNQVSKLLRTAVCTAFATGIILLGPNAASAASIKSTFSTVFFGEAGAAVLNFFQFSTQPGGDNKVIANVETTGLDALEFGIFASDAGGNPTGSAIVDNGGEGTILTTLSGDSNFFIRVAGNIAADLGADTGTINGFVKTTVVPIAPAALMLLTGIGALFGFARARKLPAAA